MRIFSIYTETYIENPFGNLPAGKPVIITNAKPHDVVGLHRVATFLWPHFVASCDVCRRIGAGVRVELW
jgi:hypothetical protein